MARPLNCPSCGAQPNVLRDMKATRVCPNCSRQWLPVDEEARPWGAWAAAATPDPALPADDGCSATARNRDDHVCVCGRRPGHPENAHLCADCRAQWRDWPGPGEAR